MREDPGLHSQLRRPTLVVAWVVAAAVLAFVLTSSASAAGDSRFATDTNAASAQYRSHKLHHRSRPVSQSAAEFVSSTTPSTQAGASTTQGGLPFTGENVIEVVALGLLLAGGGLLLARRVRRQT
jgi:LPXTG-motif cell wall-anchored protein